MSDAICDHLPQGGSQCFPLSSFKDLGQVGPSGHRSMQHNSLNGRTLAVWKGSSEEPEGQTDIDEETACRNIE